MFFLWCPAFPGASLPPHFAVLADLIASLFFHEVESVAVSLTPVQSCFGVLKEWLLLYQKWQQALFPPELPSSQAPKKLPTSFSPYRILSQVLVSPC